MVYDEMGPFCHQKSIKLSLMLVTITELLKKNLTGLIGMSYTY